MSRKRYCPLANRYCKHSVNADGNSICSLTEKPLFEYKECVKDTIYNEKHKVEIWFAKEGWQKKHFFMRGTCFEKGDYRIIFDYYGLAIQRRAQKSIRIKKSDELRELLPSLFPDWLLTELSTRIKNR